MVRNSSVCLKGAVWNTTTKPCVLPYAKWVSLRLTLVAQKFSNPFKRFSSAVSHQTAIPRISSCWQTALSGTFRRWWSWSAANVISNNVYTRLALGTVPVKSSLSSAPLKAWVTFTSFTMRRRLRSVLFRLSQKHTLTTRSFRTWLFTTSKAMKSRAHWKNKPSHCLRENSSTWFAYCRLAQEHTHARSRFLIPILKPCKFFKVWFERLEIRASPHTQSRLLWRNPKNDSMFKLMKFKCSASMAWVIRSTKFRG